MMLRRIKRLPVLLYQLAGRLRLCRAVKDLIERLLIVLKALLNLRRILVQIRKPCLIMRRHSQRRPRLHIAHHKLGLADIV